MGGRSRNNLSRGHRPFRWLSRRKEGASVAQLLEVFGGLLEAVEGVAGGLVLLDEVVFGA
jgi:hypothetical protein